jgi:hypothetical protein
MAKSDPEKLAAALRENLRKRKEQARATSEVTALPSSVRDRPPRTTASR